MPNPSRPAVRALLATAAVSTAAVTAVWAAGPAAADGTIDTPLTVNPGVLVPGQSSGDLTISGTGCVPKDGNPASVIVTIDNVDGTFTAAVDDPDGAWSVPAHVDPDAGVLYVIHATCDNYLGESVYPTYTLPIAAVDAITATPTATPPPASPSTTALANTGSPTGGLSALGGLLVAAGAGLTWAGTRAGRRRRGAHQA